PAKPRAIAFVFAVVEPVDVLVEVLAAQRGPATEAPRRVQALHGELHHAANEVMLAVEDAEVLRKEISVQTEGRVGLVSCAMWPRVGIVRRDIHDAVELLAATRTLPVALQGSQRQRVGFDGGVRRGLATEEAAQDHSARR